ncbi:caspase family protein [Streptomyces sp. Je 1-79]|uniref:caspase family protein n=1 Tax=Streptomyces sp. Je 1-79 TaxID=2943847 RepID=UPI0021A558CC|nr:caspase family protein [Streptomyces sp. Je 1-79]MCT4355569.1 caspase family protein [Streptomyces sp. Je 1-79]
MGSIYALLVGVDDYPPRTVPPLRGCLNDIAEARRLLGERAGDDIDVRVLLDHEATRDAVEDAFRNHLGRAGAGDTALFWFSGHGTQSLATEEAHLRIEATGRNQAIVCVDGPLLDKRLGGLLDEVAVGGAHVAAVLDCCFSGGATRGDGLTARYAPPAPEWDLNGLGGGHAALRDASAADGQSTRRHVLLAAARLNQYSYEGDYGGRLHGAFTHALLGAVRDAGPEASYRELLAAADARLQRSRGQQQPVLYPAEHGGIADAPFLGGATARPPTPHLLRFGVRGWEVDCGAVHGLAEGSDLPSAEFTVVPDGGTDHVPLPAPALRALEVHTAHTVVEPVGWAPVPTRVYPVALSALPQPPATVSLPETGPGGRLREAVRDAVAASPLLRALDDPQEAADLHFRLQVEGEQVHVLRRDGTPFTGPLPLRTPEDARQVADCLTHLARWHQIRDLTPGPSPLDGLVRVEISPWDAPDDQPLTPDGSGEIVCSYATGPAGLQEPRVSIRLHNRSADRTLWCVLIDLTDSYASHTALYPGHFIGPGRTGYALDGDPVQLSLPPTRPAVPGASARDWLKLIVTESELNTAPYRLDAWDPDPRTSRVMGRVTGPRGRWTTRTIPLRTVVPTDRGA